MKPGVEHKSRGKLKNMWLRNRAFCEGADEIRRMGMKILPPGIEMDEFEYLQYLSGAYVPDAAAAGLELFLARTFGDSFSVDVNGSGKEAFLEFLGSRVTPDEESFQEFFREILADVFCVGSVGVYKTISKSGANPFLVRYWPDDIHDWRVTQGEDGFNKLSGVLLHESVEVEKDGGSVTESRFRELVLEPSDGDSEEMVFKVYLHTKDKDGKFERKPVEYKDRSEQPGKIPFYFLNANGKKFGLSSTAPMSGIIQAMVQFWRVSAIKTHAMYVAGRPMALFAGFDQPNQQRKPTQYEVERLSNLIDTCNLEGFFSKNGDYETQAKTGGGAFVISTSKSLWSKQADAKGYYLALSPDALEHFSKSLEFYLEEMVATGARSLMRAGSFPKTMHEVYTRDSTADSLIAGVVRKAVGKMNAALSSCSETLGLKVEIEIQVNYDPLNLMPDQAIAAVVKVLAEAGAVSGRTLFDYGKRIGVVAGDRTYEMEQKDLESESQDFGNEVLRKAGDLALPQPVATVEGEG